MVGTYLLYELTNKGHTVRALLRPGTKPYQTNKLFSCLSQDAEKLISRVEWVEGDVLDPFSLHQAMQDVDQVYHAAALISFDPRERQKMLDINISGTANIVNACLQNGIKKLCYVSSIASLGQAEKGELIDENAKWKTSGSNSGYAISKYGGEREVWRGIEEGLEAVIVNPSVIIGAGCHARATNRLFHNVTRFLPYYTPGTNGYVDVRDVVKAMILLMESDISGERFVLNAENLSLKDFFIKIAQILNKPHPRIRLNRWLLTLAAISDELRCRITGSKPLLTRETVRAALSESYYSSEKFSKRFKFSFIPVSESLAEAFRVLGK